MYHMPQTIHLCHCRLKEFNYYIYIYIYSHVLTAMVDGGKRRPREVYNIEEYSNRARLRCPANRYWLTRGTSWVPGSIRDDLLRSPLFTIYQPYNPYYQPSSQTMDTHTHRVYTCITTRAEYIPARFFSPGLSHPLAQNSAAGTRTASPVVLPHIRWKYSQ